MNKGGNMVYTWIEWIALAFIALALIKIVILLISPMLWMNFAKRVWSRPLLMKFCGLVLGGLILYVLLWQITFTQILATMAFLACLMMIGFAGYTKELMSLCEKQIKSKNFIKQNLLSLIIWLILILWGIYVILL